MSRRVTVIEFDWDALVEMFEHLDRDDEWPPHSEVVVSDIIDAVHDEIATALQEAGYEVLEAGEGTYEVAICEVERAFGKEAAEELVEALAVLDEDALNRWAEEHDVRMIIINVYSDRGNWYDRTALIARRRKE